LKSDISTTIVVVQIGKERFNVHKDLLVARSPYFKAAFEGRFKEAKDGVLVLEDVKIEAMKDFLDWLYFGRLSPVYGEDEEDNDDNDDNEDDRFTTLEAYMEGYRSQVELYIFADRFNVPDLRKAIIDAKYDYYKDNDYVPSYKEIITASNALPASSPLCGLYVDLYTLRWDPTMDNAKEKGAQQFVPVNFLVAVMNGIGQDRWNKTFDDDYDTPALKPVEEYYEKLEDRPQGEHEHGSDTAIEE
jgi:hypothetical protein